jgi:NitT/TauT family transport system ATP-binding protein
VAETSLVPANLQDDIVLECNNVCHWFGSKRVLYNVNLRVPRGQTMALVGPSGCGKSTLLRAILGTHPPCAGTVLMEGIPCDRPNRDRGIVYQRYSLFPFLTAEENVAFGLMLDQTSFTFRWLQFWKWAALRRQHRAEAANLLERLGLSGSRRSYPEELSGGMRQRVALAQALIMQPKLLLLDEPFGALDEATREEMQLMLLQLSAENLAARRRHEQPPYTIIIVTHEINEALYVADRVVGLSQFHSEKQFGATVVYDKAAPLFKPQDPRDLDAFLAQKEEILQAVFDETSVRHYSEYVSFWKDYEALKKSSAPASPPTGSR